MVGHHHANDVIVVPGGGGAGSLTLVGSTCQMPSLCSPSQSEASGESYDNVPASADLDHKTRS